MPQRSRSSAGTPTSGGCSTTLLVDDWLETGSQARAAKSIIEACGARLIGVAVVVSEVEADEVADIGRLHALVRPDRLAWEHGEIR